MNPAPLSRREHVAISILQSLIVHPVAPGILDHQIIESAVRNADALLAELDRTAPREAGPVSPPLPERPAHIPEPPEGVVYWGNRELSAKASDDQMGDVFAFNEDVQDDNWEEGFTGLIGRGPGFTSQHYALCRGTPIARANGIPDQA